MPKTLYFQSGPATTHRGVNDTKLAGAASWWEPRRLAETRGTGAATVTAASIAGTTVGLEFVNGAVALEWLTEPLSADFTISGTITANLWGFESTMNDNTAMNFVVDKVDGATGAVTQIAKSARVAEMSTANAVNFFTATPTSTAVKRGDRLRVRPFIDDIGSAMIVGTSTFSYNGPTATVAGDSYVQFTEELTFELAGVSGALSQSDASAEDGVGFNTAFAQAAQPFVAPATSLAGVGLALRRDGVPVDNLIVEIQSDNAGSPSGTVIGTVATLLGSALPAPMPAITVYPASISLTAGLPNRVVLRRDGAISASNYYNFASAASASGWTFYKSFSTSTSLWTSRTEVMTISLAFLDLVSIYYLTDTAETINPGAATEKKALTTRGSGSVTVAASTAAGPTAGNTDLMAVEWYTPPLEAVTLGGKAKFNIRALESNAAANASLKAEIAVCNTDGTSPAVWGVANIEPSTVAGELGTTDAAYVAWVSGDDVAVTAGQRLRFRLYVEDIASGPLVTGHTVTVSYNGGTASAAGDTYVTLPVVVVEQSLGPVTRYGATSLNVTFGKATAAQRRTTSNLAMPLTFAAAVAGQVSVPAVTHYGALTAPFAFNAATAAKRRTTGQVALPVAFSKAVAGQRKTFGVTATPLTFTKAVAAQRRTTSSTALPITVGIATAGIATTGAVTHYGALAAPFTFAAVTQTRRRTTSSTAMPVTFGAVTQTRRRTTSSLAAPFAFAAVVASRKQYARTTTAITFGETTAGRKHTRSSLAFPITFGAVTKGIGFTGAATHYGATTTTITFTKQVQGRKRTTGQVALPVTFTKAVQGWRRTTGQVARPFTFAAVVQARRKTFSTIARPIIFSVYTNATSTAGGPILNNATDIRWGTIQADRVLVGTTEVWTP